MKPLRAMSSGFVDKLYWRFVGGEWHCFKRCRADLVGPAAFGSLCGRIDIESSGGQAITRPAPIKRCARCDVAEMARRGWQESGSESPLERNRMAKNKKEIPVSEKAHPGFFLLNPETGERTPIDLHWLQFGLGTEAIAIDGRPDGTLEIRTMDSMLYVEPVASNLVRIRTSADYDRRVWEAGKQIHECWKSNEIHDPMRRKGKK